MLALERTDWYGARNEQAVVTIQYSIRDKKESSTRSASPA